MSEIFKNFTFLNLNFKVRQPHLLSMPRWDSRGIAAGIIILLIICALLTYNMNRSHGLSTGK